MLLKRISGSTKAVLLSFALCTLYNAALLLGITVETWRPGFHCQWNDIVIPLFFGIPMGLVCAPVTLLCLSRKNLRVAGAVLAVGGVVYVVLLCLSPAHTPAHSVLAWLAFVALYHVACVWLRRRLPDIEGYPACTCCGYNLTGNISGVCPECGTGIDAGCG